MIMYCSKYQKKRNERQNFCSNNKTVIIFFAITILASFILQTKSASADSPSLAEKIEKAKKNIVWIDKKYDTYLNLGETIVGVLKDENIKHVRLDFMDNNLKTIINYKYADKEFLISDFIDDWGFLQDSVPVPKDNKYGYIDKTGKEIVKPKYDDAYEFSEDLARVQKDDKWGFIDKTGKEVIPIKYDYAEGFSEGLAEVKLNNKWFYINQKGECVKDCNNAPADHPIAK